MIATVAIIASTKYFAEIARNRDNRFSETVTIIVMSIRSGNRKKKPYSGSTYFLHYPSF
jgi:hypothetical protein